MEPRGFNVAWGCIEAHTIENATTVGFRRETGVCLVEKMVKGCTGRGSSFVKAQKQGLA